MTDKVEKPRISGKEATHVAMEAQEYRPVQICAADDSMPHTKEPEDKAQVPAPMNGTRARSRNLRGRQRSLENYIESRRPAPKVDELLYEGALEVRRNSRLEA